MPHVSGSARYAYTGYCVLVMAVCVLIAVSPNGFFRFLARLVGFSKSPPKMKPWVEIAYRTIAIVGFLWILLLLVKVIRS
jgi:hypothetical protein